MKSADKKYWRLDIFRLKHIKVTSIEHEANQTDQEGRVISRAEMIDNNHKEQKSNLCFH